MKRASFVLSWTLTVLVFGTPNSSAQERVWAGDRTINQISEHVFRWGSDGQYGAYILTNEGIILVDGHYCQSGTVEWLKDQLDRRYDVPVRYVVLSHDHQDHNCNTGLFSDTAVGVGHRNIVPHLTFEQRNSIIPAITFEDEMDLMLGGILVKLLYFGPTHSDNLIQVHIPQEGVLIAIDSAKGRNLFPDFRDMEVNNQLKVMRTLANLEDVSIVLPGHGPVTTQDAFLDHHRYLQTLKDTVLQHMADGRTLQEIKTLTEASMLEEFGDYNRIDAYLVPNIVTMWDYLYRYRESNSRITDIEAMECIEDSRQCRTSD
jgi:glyoxylase-like metal-dependent hydrolase (beta-lactamase superfamily II)